jgi:hypothetical protein
MVKGRRYSRKGLFRRQQVALYFSQKRRRIVLIAGGGAGAGAVVLNDGFLLPDGSSLVMTDAGDVTVFFVGNKTSTTSLGKLLARPTALP